jgi:branched-chain amino acid transport system ATP-binding protein
MLQVEGLEAGYHGAQVLFGVDLGVGAGEVVAVLGRNGMGKTTTVRALFGLIRPRAGRVVFEGQDLTGRPPYAIGQRGLSLVPEGRQVFPTLTVEENLVATAAARFGAPRWTLPAIYGLFPRLAERRRNLGSQLSGGEQQMLAIGRALMTNPKLLVLDEATEGLAPLIRSEIWACLSRLKAEGEAIVIIDKNVEALTRLADRHLVIEKGRVAWAGTSAELSADRSVKERYLHVGTGAGGGEAGAGARMGVGAEPPAERLEETGVRDTQGGRPRVPSPLVEEGQGGVDSGEPTVGWAPPAPGPSPPGGEQSSSAAADALNAGTSAIGVETSTSTVHRGERSAEQRASHVDARQIAIPADGREAPVAARPAAERQVRVGTSEIEQGKRRMDTMMMPPTIAKATIKMPPGITKAGEGFDHIAWNILGQVYIPKQVSETSLSWHATFPPETFVPPHIHPTQDEFIYMLEGQFELMLDGKTVHAGPGDLVRMPMGIPHAIFNKSGRTVKCFFWVSPTRRLYDLFWAIHNMAEQTPAEVVALSAKHEVDFLPPPEEPK